MPIRRLTLDGSLQLHQIFDLDNTRRFGDALADFQVRLAIEIRGFDEGNALRLTRRQLHEIGWEEIVVLHFDDVADRQVLPLHHHPSAVLEAFDLAVINLIIGAVSFLKG